MQEDEDDLIEFGRVSSTSRKAESPVRVASTDISPDLARVGSSGIQPFRRGSYTELNILEELRGVLDINLPGNGGDDNSGKDDLRHTSQEDVDERRGRSTRPKTIFWNKKNFGPGNWIQRGTESPTRDLSPIRGGYDLIERSVSPVRQPRGW